MTRVENRGETTRGKRLGGKRLGGETSCDRSEWYRVFLSRMCTQGPPMLRLFIFGH